jgi:molybdopterin/thiamine biosynthesis adenylyltransferase
MILSDDELTRYARHIVLKEFGGTGQARLKAATVAIVGAGGVGSPAIQYLGAAGVGRLILIDDDTVEPSNLQRQTIFRTADTGIAKVDAAAAAVKRINPNVSVDTHRVRIDADNVAALLAGADVVLDGCENTASLGRRRPVRRAASDLSRLGGRQAVLPVFRR